MMLEIFMQSVNDYAEALASVEPMMRQTAVINAQFRMLNRYTVTQKDRVTN